MTRRIFVPVLAAALMVTAGAAHAQQSSFFLPLGGSKAGDRDLPRPLGIGVTLYKQDQGYGLLSVPLPDQTLALLGVDRAALEAALPGIAVDSDVHEYNLRLDAWLFPFLDVFALLGKVDGETNVKLEPFQLPNLVVDYDGLVYGVGLTLAGGVDQFFAAFTATYTATNLDNEDSSVEAWALLPRAGVRFKNPGAGRAVSVWAGAMYQDVEEHHRGVFGFPGLGEIGYDVLLEEKDPWNALVGLSWEITDRFHVELEAGFGERDHMTGSFTYRFF